MEMDISSLTFHYLTERDIPHGLVTPCQQSKSFSVISEEKIFQGFLVTF